LPNRWRQLIANKWRQHYCPQDDVNIIAHKWRRRIDHKMTSTLLLTRWRQLTANKWRQLIAHKMTWTLLPTNSERQEEERRDCPQMTSTLLPTYDVNSTAHKWHQQMTWITYLSAGHAPDRGFQVITASRLAATPPPVSLRIHPLSKACEDAVIEWVSNWDGLTPVTVMQQAGVITAVVITDTTSLIEVTTASHNSTQS
jgi:hypothetical protein